MSEGRQASRPAASAGRHRDWVQSMTGRARGRLLWHSLVRRASSCHGCLSPAQGSMLDVPKRAHNCRPRCLGDAGVDDPVGVVDEIEAGGGGGAQPRCSGGIWKCLADATAGVIAARGGRAGQGRAGQELVGWQACWLALCPAVACAAWGDHCGPQRHTQPVYFKAAASHCITYSSPPDCCNPGLYVWGPLTPRDLPSVVEVAQAAALQHGRQACLGQLPAQRSRAGQQGRYLADVSLSAGL